jgi:hypothetical protein
MTPFDAQILGWLAGGLTLATVVCPDLRRLHLLALAANAAFIGYAAAGRAHGARHRSSRAEPAPACNAVCATPRVAPGHGVEMPKPLALTSFRPHDHYPEGTR